MARTGDKDRLSNTNTIITLSNPPQREEDERETSGSEYEDEDGEIGGGLARLPRFTRQNPQKIPENVKERIVELFATFHTHRQVLEIIREEYHMDISRHTLAIYDPERVACQLGKRLRRYYSTVRERYSTSASQTAMAHQAHRLRQLENIVDLATRAKDFSSAIKALELAGKEMGGLLQAGNSKVTVEHTGTIGHVHATVEEARREVAMRLASLMERTPELQAALPAPDTEKEEGGEEGGMGIQVID